MSNRKTLFRKVSLLLAPLILIILAAAAWLFTVDPARVTVTEGEISPSRPAAAKEILLYAYLQSQADQLSRPQSDDPAPLGLTIEPGDSVATVADRLAALGLIDDPLLFRRFLSYNGLDVTLEAGDYELRQTMTMKEIALTLQSGRLRAVTITIPEGWRAEQIADLLAVEGLMSGEDFMAVVRAGVAVEHPLLADRPAGAGYEGYLYPDTYRLDPRTTPAGLIARMVDNLAAQLPADAVELAAAQNLTLHQALTIASIVEREAVVATERPLIAGVYLNRLAPDSPHPYLESDPTVQYAMGFQPESGQWWKTPLFLSELKAVDSPYNTFLYPGLPPGPMANPGIASIEAVLDPVESDYYFFVCRNPGCEGGEHIFSKTFEEHLRNVENYYGGQLP